MMRRSFVLGLVLALAVSVALGAVYRDVMVWTDDVAQAQRDLLVTSAGAETGTVAQPLYVADVIGGSPVSANNPMAVTYQSRLIDAFGRFRVSAPTGLFDAKLVRGKEPLFWAEQLTGGATATHLTDNPSVRMTAAANGDKAIRQTRARIVYQPGKSLRNLMTFVLGSAQANVRRRVGWFDANNGIFLQQTGTDLQIVIRSKASGVVVDTGVAAANWSIDGFGLEGNPLNPSGITLDVTKSQILWMDVEWLAVGTVSVGFVINRTLYYATMINHANLTSIAYMGNANLPLRYEIEATGVIGAAHSLDVICSESTSEGGYDPVGLAASADRGTAVKSIDNTLQELIAIRIKAANVDDTVVMIAGITALASTNANSRWAVVINPTGLAAGAWVSAGANSSVEYNITRTGVVTGHDHQMFTGMFSQDVDATQPDLNTNYRLGADVAGTADIMSLVIQRADGGGAAESYNGGMNWREVF